MSRGLGKWEKFIVNKLTHYCKDIEAFITSSSISSLANLYFNFGEKDICEECSHNIFYFTTYQEMSSKQKSIYQSIARASRTLEQKGIVTKRIVPDGCDPENDYKIVWEKWVDIVNFYDKRNKCFISKYHYLSKRLTVMRKIETANRLFIRERCCD